MYQPSINCRIFGLALGLSIVTWTAAVAEKPKEKSAGGDKAARAHKQAESSIRKQLPFTGPKHFYILRIDGASSTTFERIQGSEAAVDRAASAIDAGNDASVALAFRGNQQGERESEKLVADFNLKANEFEQRMRKQKKSFGPVFMLEMWTYKPRDRDMGYAKRNETPNGTVSVETKWAKVVCQIYDKQEAAMKAANWFLERKEPATIKRASIVPFKKRSDAHAYLQTVYDVQFFLALQQFRYWSPQALRFEYGPAREAPVPDYR